MEGIGTPLARLSRATVVLDDRAVLRGVDLELTPGGITLLRGPNGSGKTTLLRALAGLVPLARGRRDLSGALLYLGHRPQLLRGLTARENLAFFAAFRGLPDPPVDAALELWGIAAIADRPVERLSAGQRRRAALARLSTEACSIVLLDEPFAELDAEGAALLRDLLGVTRDLGAALLLASHAQPELDGIASRVHALREGRLS